MCCAKGKIIVSPVPSEIILPKICTNNNAMVEKKNHTAVFRCCSFYPCFIAMTYQGFQKWASFSRRHGCLPEVSKHQTFLAKACFKFTTLPHSIFHTNKCGRPPCSCALEQCFWKSSILYFSFGTGTRGTIYKRSCLSVFVWWSGAA